MRALLPFPKTGAAAIAKVMLYLDHRRMAICAMLTLTLYLRLPEGIALLERHPVAPGLAAGASSASWGLLPHVFELGQPSETSTSTEHGVTGPLFDQALGSVRTPLLTGQNGGATSGASRRREEPAA